MPELRLIANQASGSLCHHLCFEADQASLASYTNPGQYLIIEHGDQQGFYALATAPGSGNLELLIKNQGGLAETLCAALPDSRWQSSLAQGGGFKQPPDQRQHLHLFAMGSGLGPLRALVHTYLQGNWPAASLTVWISAFTTADLPFADEYVDWQNQGVQVITCLDQDPGQESHGIVPMLTEIIKPDLSQAMAYWIGSKGYGEAIALATAKQGLPASNLSSNY